MAGRLTIGILVVLILGNAAVGAYAYLLDREVDTLSDRVAALQEEVAAGFDASAGELAALIEQIQAEGVPALFAENVSNPDLIERIAQETGATVGDPLYTDALGATDSNGATYIDMVRHNVNAMVTALSE